MLLIWTERQPGQAATPPATLPQEIVSSRTPGRSTVIVAIHPQCPCTRATIANLESAWKDAAPGCDLVALVYTPDGRPAEWSNTDSVKRATSLQGARRIDDPNGQTSAALGIATSGQVLVYDADGRLRFAGGITPSRGHEGACASLETFRAAIAGTPHGQPQAATVFGCSLCNENSNICSVRPANADSHP